MGNFHQLHSSLNFKNVEYYLTIGEVVELVANCREVELQTQNLNPSHAIQNILYFNLIFLSGGKKKCCIEDINTSIYFHDNVYNW
jgi:hypothetical protein